MARKKNPAVAKAVNDPLRYVREFAPSLVVARASLLPFDDCILEESAGPQNGEAEQPYFHLAIRDRQYGDDVCVEVTVTADTVAMAIVDYGDDDLRGEIDSWTCSLESLWDYLRQLPRQPRSFRKRV